jgi:hypothetical protein
MRNPLILNGVKKICISGNFFVYIDRFSVYNNSVRQPLQIMTQEEIKKRIIAIIDNYTTDMDFGSSLGANFGVSADDYEDIAEDILTEFEICG